MVDASKMIKSRKETLQNLFTLTLSHDAAIEKLKREVKRMLSRKKAIPDEEDLRRLGDMLKLVSKSLLPIASAIDKGFQI